VGVHNFSLSKMIQCGIAIFMRCARFSVEFFLFNCSAILTMELAVIDEMLAFSRHLIKLVAIESVALSCMVS